MKRKATRWFSSILAMFLAQSALAIEFDEVRNFEEVFVISASAPSRDMLEVRWKIEDDYYLYNNKFLKFVSGTDGVILGDPVIPPGEIAFDDLLGKEVEKFHHELIVTLPLLSVPAGVEAVQIKARSQGCLENVLCYPPTQQLLIVSIPPELADPGVLSTADPSGPLLIQDDRPALPPEAAFVFESIGYSPDTALVRITAQPGYYLYADKFEFRVVGNDSFTLSEVDLPAGVIKDDPEFGPVAVYYGLVEIPVHLNRPAGPATEISLEAAFQGCRDGDICYPPMSRTVNFQMPAADEATARQVAVLPTANQGSPAMDVPVTEQDKLALLLTRHPARALVAFFIAGLLLAFTPCVLPMLPILSGIIVGQGDRLTTLRAFWLSLIYVLAMAVTYTVAGVLAGLFGQNLQAAFQNPWIISGFVLIFILLALSMFGFYELQLPGRIQTRLAEASNRQQGGQLWGVAVMGFLSALIVGPCVAPPLMAALIVIGSSGDAVLGGAALFSLAMGMGVPLLLFGISAGKLVPKAGAWMDAVKAVFGVGLLGLAIWMLERILPGGLIMLLWGALAIGCGIYLGALERIETGSSGWKRLWKSLGIIFLVAGILEIVGAAAGGDYWLRPLESLRSVTGAATVENRVEFQRVKSVDDLEQALARAGSSGHGVMLDFYADWCVECIRMERNTFPEDEVQKKLDQLMLLQADVTANDEVDQQLMKSFGIIGPPAILFFDRSGEEMKALRLVGYFEAEEFAAHLQQVLTAQ
ncbi:MAG: protein-disulfide reductase DsbD [Gammaproteobacteria bacterium]|jgi:thiol:disulfide interchange protein DsbD|nr:protein-disulfide reductase DsbD [Gammaproteobacteria bacterium]